tara:strand:- start:246 stop:416 length:171 start_codon:yes stop_codon:yes gene_type:complete
MESYDKDRIGLYQLVSHGEQLYRIDTTTGYVYIMIWEEIGRVWEWKYFGGDIRRRT